MVLMGRMDIVEWAMCIWGIEDSVLDRFIDILWDTTSTTLKVVAKIPGKNCPPTSAGVLIADAHAVSGVIRICQGSTTWQSALCAWSHAMANPDDFDRPESEIRRNAIGAALVVAQELGHEFMHLCFFENNKKHNNNQIPCDPVLLFQSSLAWGLWYVFRDAATCLCDSLGDYFGRDDSSTDATGTAGPMEFMLASSADLVTNFDLKASARNNVCTAKGAKFATCLHTAFKAEFF